MCAENLNNLKAVPERSEIPQQDKWNLEAIYKSFDDWESAFDLISKKIQELAGYAGKLGDNNGDNLLKFLKA
ncbi:MAG: hypothetical protein IJG62_01260, partial [Synergistaceae bacterium]|nr:hypothetical protein [Synergistaceae bacterium]